MDWSKWTRSELGRTLRWHCGGCSDGCGGSGGFFSSHAKFMGAGMVSRVIPCLFFLFFISNVAIRGDQCHSLGHGSVCIGSTN